MKSKPTTLPADSEPGNGHLANRGFALVATLMLIVLLAILAVGLLSLATIGMRTSRNGLEMAEARANARLAVMVAIGELQKQLGPDQRISATSGICDTVPDTPGVDGLEDSSRILGVWDSWQTWLNARFKTREGADLSIQDTYQKGRHENLFRAWLVSHADRSLLEKPGTPYQSGFGFNETNSAILVGNGGSGNRQSGEVPVRGGLVQTNGTGAMAWWVGAENEKSSIQNPVVKRASPEEIRAGIDSISHMDVRGLDGLGDLPLDEEHTRRYVTTPSAGVPLRDGTILPAHFHSLTPFSRSLLVDVRDGRFKKDLSLMFEKDTLPADYRKTRTWEPGVRPRSNDLAQMRPPLTQRTLFSWERMFNYYRLYREQDNPIPNATLKSVFKPSVQYDGAAPYVTMYLNKNKRSAVGTYNDAAYVRVPVILKHYANIGLQTEKISSTPERYNYYVDFAPVTVLWNPYNVRLQLPNDFLGQTTLFYKNIPLEYKIWVNSQPRTGWVHFGFDRSATTLGGDLQTHFTKTGRSSGSPIVFEPGEMLIFSHSSDSADKWKNAKFQLGYQPQNFDSRRMLIPGLSDLTGRPKVNISLRFESRLGDNSGGAGANTGSFAVRYTTVHGTLGSNQVTESAEVKDSDAHMPCWFGIDWFQPTQANQILVPDSPRSSAPFQYSDNEPYAIASVGITAKCGTQPDYSGLVTWETDWRNKNWLNSSPAFFGTQLFNPTDRNRSECPYFLHFAELDGGVDISSVSPHSGNNGILGSGVAGADQVSFAPVLEIPTRPIASLAGFAGARLLPGWWDESRFSSESPVSSDLTWMIKRMSYHSGVPGVGIGNSFAHPMLQPAKVYTYQDVSKCDNRSYTDAFSDYWDHLLLANDALWDQYFLSSIATRNDSGSPTRPSDTVRMFFKENKPLDDVRLQPSPGRLPADLAIDEILADDGWERIAAYLMVNGGFNVNSTSLEAWKSLFHGLLGRPLVYQKKDGSLGTIVPYDDQAVLGRFHLATTNEECEDPRSGVIDPDTGLSRWSDVRYITRSQLDKLAEECLRQVKLRGPFLNMSEFINRRLDSDDLGLRGALQAAIDYDDDAPDSSSINYRYKQSGDMITLNKVSALGYPFPKAAAGSRYTAIPGYVVQSDVLQAFGNTLTVRDDTFRIRGYGEARDSSGKVVARAWCEAVVQRYPEFVDPANDIHAPAVLRDVSGNARDNPAFTELNRRFGRRFGIVQFRWLDQGEV